MSAEVLAVWCCSKCGAVYYKDFPRCPNDGAEVVLAMRDPLLDQRIGHYVVDRLIGEGGMGRVYAAHHATLPTKRYAIKVLLGDVAATASMRKRFSREAEAASRLVHPNLVGVVDFGEMASGLPYIVMDFVDGVALTKLIESPMDPARVMRIARGVCQGLAYAHEAGIVHRDLKPDNVMIVVDADGSEIPRIADFGLAMTVEQANARLTTTGVAIGTPAYSAPEQMAAKHVDRRADLYALGTTMFEMLTGGVLPFEGHALEMMSAKAHREARRLTEIMPAVTLPAGLEDLVMRLIRRRPGDRPDSARAVIAELDNIVLGLATIDERAATVLDVNTPSHLPKREMRTERTRGRRGLARWLFAATALLAAGGGWWYLAHRDTPPHGISADLVARSPSPAAPPLAPAPSEPGSEAGIERVADVEPVSAPAIEHPAEARHTNPRTQQEHRRKRNARATAKQTAPRIAPSPDPKPAPAPEPRSVPPPDPQPAPPPDPPPPPVLIATRIQSVDVHGALSPASVRRAVERVQPAVRRCAPASPQKVSVRFTIDESRRARRVRASGAEPTIGCVIAALGGVRSETAPDVGDAEVEVEIAFVAQ